MTEDRVRQLAFDMPHSAGLEREDFLVAPSNRMAVELIDRWPDWPTHAALLIGPAGSGKSHLLEIWRRRSGARIVFADELTKEMAFELMEAGGAAAIDGIPGSSLDERALLHLLNLTRETRGHVMIAARSTPASWNLRLADLTSRLAAATSVALDIPGDSLLRGVLVKLFADRQIAADEALIAYLLSRMPRSMAAAQLLVRTIDERALEEHAEITRPFAARVVSTLFEPSLFEPDEDRAAVTGRS